MTTPTPPADRDPWAPPAEGAQGPTVPPAPGEFGLPVGAPADRTAGSPADATAGPYADPAAGSPAGTPAGLPVGTPAGPPPGFGYGFPPQDAFLPYQPPRNGMGITALVLGIVGVLLGLLVFLFWASWLPALLAVVFGIIGLGNVRNGAATNKGMAMTGMILGLAGLLLAIGGGVLVLTSLRDGLRDLEDHAIEVSTSETGAADGQDELFDGLDPEQQEESPAEPLALGATRVYDDGVKVTVAKPTAFTPGSYAAEQRKPHTKALLIKITVVNGSKDSIDLTGAYPTVTDAKGTTTEVFIDPDHVKFFAKTVLPGKQAVATYTYELPEKAAGELQVEFSPNLTDLDSQVWAGPTK